MDAKLVFLILTFSISVLGMLAFVIALIQKQAGKRISKMVVSTAIPNKSVILSPAPTNTSVGVVRAFLQIIFTTNLISSGPCGQARIFQTLDQDNRAVIGTISICMTLGAWWGGALCRVFPLCMKL